VNRSNSTWSGTQSRRQYSCGCWGTVLANVQRHVATNARAAWRSRSVIACAPGARSDRLIGRTSIAKSSSTSTHLASGVRPSRTGRNVPARPDSHDRGRAHRAPGSMRRLHATGSRNPKTRRASWSPPRRSS
jgi:hypothetical protein